MSELFQKKQKYISESKSNDRLYLNLPQKFGLQFSLSLYTSDKVSYVRGVLSWLVNYAELVVGQLVS